MDVFFLDFWDFFGPFCFFYFIFVFFAKNPIPMNPKITSERDDILGIFGVFLLDGLDGNRKIGLRKVASWDFFWWKNSKQHALEKLLKT